MEPSPGSAYFERRNAVLNRIRCFLIHIPRYSIEGKKRLAEDIGVSPSTISRLVRGETAPTYQLADAVTRALSKRMGVPLEIRDVFTTDGTYLTACVCDLSPNCNGCYPPEAYDDDDTMRPEFREMRPGAWCTFAQTPVQPDISASKTGHERH
jgi:transcriptional regulator with XRE-family HTH domain